MIYYIELTSSRFVQFAHNLGFVVVFTFYRSCNKKQSATNIIVPSALLFCIITTYLLENNTITSRVISEGNLHRWQWIFLTPTAPKMIYALGVSGVYTHFRLQPYPLYRRSSNALTRQERSFPRTVKSL